MLNMKTKMNHILLNQTIERSKCMKYFEKMVRLIGRGIEEFRKNTMEKGASFAQRCFFI